MGIWGKPKAAAPEAVDNTPRTLRMVQTVLDLARRRIEQCRVLDLGCAHGFYALEFAKRGAATLGVEGRQAWVDMANKTKADLGLTRAEFLCRDVRDLPADTLGVFDVVLCLGLLYHLDADDALGLLQTVHDLCGNLAVIDTQFALRPDRTHTWRGEDYRGWAYREHPPGASAERKTAEMGSSLDNDFSFWFSRPSLLNALRHVGFSSVFEVCNPIDNVVVNGEFKLHADYITLVAVKGEPVTSVFTHPDLPEQQDWPEDAGAHIWRRPWTK